MTPLSPLIKTTTAQSIMVASYLETRASQITPMPTLIAKNGFESLKEFDSNNDDIIDEKDKEFTNLLLWQDKNSNGISETDELIKLSDKAEFTNLNLLIA